MKTIKKITIDMISDDDMDEEYMSDTSSNENDQEDIAGNPCFDFGVPFDSDGHNDRYEKYRKESLRVVRKIRASLIVSSDKVGNLDDQVGNLDDPVETTEDENNDNEEEVVIDIKQLLNWVATNTVVISSKSINDIIREEEKHKKRESSEKEWINAVNKKNQRKDKSVAASSQTDVSRKTRMCKNKDNCKYGKKCSFAHSQDELAIKTCTYEDNCNFTVLVSGVYHNRDLKKKCGYIHPSETVENYNKRMTEDMLFTPKHPREHRVLPNAIPKVAPKAVYVTKTQQPPKKDKKQTAKDKIKEQIKDTAETIRTNNNVIERFSNRDIESCKAMIVKLSLQNKQLEEKLKALNTKLAEDDKHTNTAGKKERKSLNINMEILEIVSNKPAVTKPVAVDTKPVITVKPVVVTKPVITVKSIVVTKPVVEVKGWSRIIAIHKEDATPQQSEDVSSTVKVITKPISTPKSEDGWKQVKDTSRRKPEQKNTKTQLCKSIIDKQPCRHGKQCRYAHTAYELSIKECGYKDTCKMVAKKNGKYVNASSKCCSYQHTGETKNSVYDRINKFLYN